LSILETDRLILSELKTKDAKFIHKLYNDQDFINYIGDKGIHSVQDAVRFINTGPIQSYKNHEHGLYLIKLKDETSIGVCGLLKRDDLDLPDIGFAILPDYRRMGFIYEASKAVIEDGKNRLYFDSLFAITTPDNIGSINLLKKLGFTLKDIIKRDKNNEPIQLYAIYLDS
jgi:RimJ/RimL family protein N-acetyltransferase